MIDTLKKTLLAGVGAAVVTTEKIEAALDDFVKQGKVTATDAREMAMKIASDGRKEFDQVSEQLSGRIKELIARFDATTKERLDALEARVAALEAKRRSSPRRQS